MRVSFGLKVAIAIAFVSLLASTVAIVYFYLLIESNVWAEMSRRLRDIGKTGVALITAEQREDLIRLDRMLAERQAGVDESFLAEIEDGGYAEPIPEEDAAKLGQTREFLEVAQILRLIKAGTLKESIYPEPLDQLLNRPDQKATLKYAYLLAPIKESPDFQVVRFLGDADYEEIDMNGNGKIDDDEEGVPPGLLYRISDQPEMLRAFREGVVTNTLEPTPDAWGVWYSGMVPIKDANGKVIAVLGVDMDVNSELNLLKKFRWAAATSLIIIFFATLISAYLIARFLANPILKLREAAEKVQDRDFSVQVRVRGGDELGQLADGFNAMVREIRIYSDQMEDLVAERTARLEESLRQVQELKDRQDGDYYLSTLLTNPLFKNRNKSENV
ncbi:MAG: HAMP domain-containing protein, partial [Leptospiraceae bacterium]|nr:HAMP domain-containing protein [Leptospiraceae bacterium]